MTPGVADWDGDDSNPPHDSSISQSSQLVPILTTSWRGHSRARDTTTPPPRLGYSRWKRWWGRQKSSPSLRMKGYCTARGSEGSTLAESFLFMDSEEKLVGAKKNLTSIRQFSRKSSGSIRGILLFLSFQGVWDPLTDSFSRKTTANLNDWIYWFSHWTKWFVFYIMNWGFLTSAIFSFSIPNLNGVRTVSIERVSILQSPDPVIFGIMLRSLC